MRRVAIGWIACALGVLPGLIGARWHDAAPLLEGSLDARERESLAAYQSRLQRQEARHEREVFAKELARRPPPP